MNKIKELIENLGLKTFIDHNLAFKNNARIYDWFLDNRICALPMEGWDATKDGKPSDVTLMRWKRYGASGVSLVWGEAAAVSMDARSHFKQLVLIDKNQKEFEELLLVTKKQRENSFGKESLKTFRVGIQLLHGGRFAKPKPMPVFHDEYLDRATKIDPSINVISDEEIEKIIEDYIKAAILAKKIGFDFIDIKLCHGYLGHEILGAKKRQGKYGGPIENRTRFIREIAEALKREAKGIKIASRISFFEPPAKHGLKNPDYSHFGVKKENPYEWDINEWEKLLNILLKLDIKLIAPSLGTPYTTPWLVRPAKKKALFENDPPEHWIKGIERHIKTSQILKKLCPEMNIVIAGLSALGSHLLQIGASLLENKICDFVGLGRSLLANPELPKLLLSKDILDEKILCKACGLCTTMARKGKFAGCYLHDHFYKKFILNGKDGG